MKPYNNKPKQNQNQANEVAQWVEAPSAEPENWIPGTDRVERLVLRVVGVPVGIFVVVFLFLCATL